MNFTLDTPISSFNRVGQTLAKRLAILGIKTANDILHHFPFRYEDYSQTTPIGSLVVGQQTTIRATIELLHTIRIPRKKMMITEALVADDTGQIKIIWFNQPFIKQVLAVGDECYFAGVIKQQRRGIELVSPMYEKIHKEQETLHTARIVPVYPTTNGVTQKQLRHIVAQALPLVKEIEDWIPADIQMQAKILPLRDAMQAIHMPITKEEQHLAEERLKFDELFILQLRAEIIRQSIAQQQAPALAYHDDDMKAYVAGLPFTLTNGQKIATWEIIQDMMKPIPMNRLLQGDVGVGKTAVAALAMLHAVQNDMQAMIMAPTEILAAQHAESFFSLYKTEDIRIGLYTRSYRTILHTKEQCREESIPKKKMQTFIHDGHIDILIGTHALLSDGITLPHLALCIVDEQHRFGVDQRKKMKEKSQSGMHPHFLSMTATPIPRSYALTIYGDLDVSLIKDKPAERKEIKTRFVEPHNRQKAYEFIRQQLTEGRQAFVVCSLIKHDTDKPVSTLPSLQTERKAVMAEYTKLQQTVFPNYRIAYVHGGMSAEEKETTMQAFANHETDILVATSVVEVGVNIPNASVMMIEDADRFGLAQLHQFRGRVGRSSHQSYCFVCSDSQHDAVRERLTYFETHSDGFAVAEYDLQTRGPGDVYGFQQSGMQQFRLATMQDISIIKKARDIAKGIDFARYPSLLQKVGEWEQHLHRE